MNSPSRDAHVSSPIDLQGQARVFENTVHYRLRVGEEVVTEGTTKASPPDIGQFGPFSSTLSFPRAYAGQGAQLEVYGIRAQDGTPEHTVTIPLHLE